MKKFPNLKDPFHFAATLGGIGMVPIAPGTFGSITAWIIFVYLSHFISMINMLILTILFFILSIWICSEASKDLENKDHKSIVIDELVGMWIALLPVLVIANSQYERTVYALAALILFRFFDILKPFPISYFDKNYKNGFGIVIDDVISGLIAIIPSYLILILLS
ncbi:MAG: phosphatidylglycerophosphatase A [Gammaproteobacteria bacterium]|jgi:phosphatidylglycerophosphatase A|nr:phosphatidylglycerophosphatase A [Gammaproteobacteria bacterium]|tara:strand:- start:1202 stop:1696 length:495 start_codon:yes stop_codon:yes gene_type:complete